MDPIGKFSEVVDADDNLTLAAFVFQLTNKDVTYAQSTGYWDSLDLQHKIELLADSVLGRTINYTPFPKVAKYSQTFNLSNAINTTSEVGVGLIFASAFGLLDAKWRKRGEKIAIGGALGGVFDDPVTSYGLGPSGQNAQARNMPVPTSEPWTSRGGP